jgi:hypothetical protein
MTRFVIKAASCAAVLVLMAVPGTAAGQQTRTVDEAIGPVSFANAVAVQLGDGGPGSGRVITETQRSPVTPGSSKLSQDRSLVPASDGEQDAIGPHYVLDLGRFEPEASPFPQGVDSREHNVVATLRDTTVPTAVAESNYALRDRRLEGSSEVAGTVLAFVGARSSVECASPDVATAETTASALWVLGEDGALAPVLLPRGGAELRLPNLPFGAPLTPNGANPDATSDVVIRRVTEFDQLLRQEKWRDGEVTAAAGWLVEIISEVPNSTSAHAEDAEDAEGVDAQGEDTEMSTQRTRVVFGGVSCSVPRGFTALASPAGQQRSSVPVRIPAGVSVQETGLEPLGYTLLGGGVTLAALALLVLLRARRAVPGQVSRSGE